MSKRTKKHKSNSKILQKQMSLTPLFLPLLPPSPQGSCCHNPTPKDSSTSETWKQQSFACLNTWTHTVLFYVIFRRINSGKIEGNTL